MTPRGCTVHTYHRFNERENVRLMYSDILGYDSLKLSSGATTVLVIKDIVGLPEQPLGSLSKSRISL